MSRNQGVAPVSTGSLLEEDLMPLGDPGQGKAYWQQVSLLVSRSWARQVRGVRRSPAAKLSGCASSLSQRAGAIDPN